MDREEILMNALLLASKRLYHEKGCNHSGMCTVATTCYTEEQEESICSKCWAHMFIERASQQVAY